MKKPIKRKEFTGNLSNIPFSPDLISFEEITDYSLITQLTKGSKRKIIETKPEKPIKKAKKAKTEELVDEIVTEKPKKKAKKEKVVEESSVPEKKLKKKKKVDKKSKTSNSTSQLSMNKSVPEDTEVEINEEELYEKMSAWSDLLLPKSILRGLCASGFMKPTPIQCMVVPDAIKERKNVIGAAQTGSGKTLAFGLPILTRLCDAYEQNNVDVKKTTENTAPQALILTPTRELAIQIKQHLQVCAKYQKTKIVVVVGGISQLKQERLLKKLPEIIVATPGRLMQMIEEKNEYLCKIDQIKYLVIDEADRMIEKQHYSELEKILALVNSNEKLKQKRQNFLFSATLITSFAGVELKKKEQSGLDALINKIQMTKDPKVVDLTTKQVTAETLFQTKIFCTLEEKDVYLYYFTSKYVGRTLVFANSIDCVRRLTNLFRLLRKEPLHLHANMNQKQRCKNLEKFNAQENSLLIASDVAARGLDIPGVMHVIHYQVPRSTDIYIHRSGRTARSMHEGLSVLLVSPDENNLYRKILQTFKNECELREYPIDVDYYSECKKRVMLARKINLADHQQSKQKSNTNWFEKNAKLLDIDLDDQILKENHVDNDKQRVEKQKLNSLKRQLDSDLNKMIMPKFFSKNYLQVGSIEKVKSINNKKEVAIDSIKKMNKFKIKA